MNAMTDMAHFMPASRRQAQHDLEQEIQDAQDAAWVKFQELVDADPVLRIYMAQAERDKIYEIFGDAADRASQRRVPTW